MLLAAVLEKAGHEVHLLDANAVKNKRSTEEIIRIAGELKPDIIGMTLLTPMISESYRLASGLKGTGAKLLAGGPHATILPEEAICHGFDAAVLGEGALTVEEAVKALLGLMPKEDVRGWVYRDSSGQPRRTEPRPPITNLDDLPFPARHLVNPLDYGPLKNPSLNGDLFSSRGCSGRCAFCCLNLFGKHVRFRSAQSILDEILYAYNTYSTRHFYFVDDAMTADRERAAQICEGLLHRNLKITWSMITRIDLVDEELLTLVARAGCWRIEYGVESGHPETLKRIHKHHTVDMARRVVPMTARLGIEPSVFFILGFPWDDTVSIEATRNLMMELAPYVKYFQPALGLLIPYPGTEIYDNYKEQCGLENWWLSSNSIFDAPRVDTHSYCDWKIFPYGNMLDANFFHYDSDVKRKIHDVFKFMYIHGQRRAGGVFRLIRLFLLELSDRLFVLSPALEHLIFTPIRALERLGQRIYHADVFRARR